MDIKSGDIILNKFNSNVNKLIQESHISKKDDKALKKVCKDFESFFINYMFKEMRKTVPKYDLIPETNAKKIFDSMFYEKLSDKLAERGGIGIANMLYENIKQENFSK